MTKKIFSIILILGILLTGCGSSAPKEVKSIKIGVAMYDQYDVFLSQMMTSFNEYANQKSRETGVSINVDIYNGANSQSTQNNQVKNMINNGFDVICVNMVDRTDTSYIIDLAKENDVPIVFFNRELVSEDLERWDKLYYVGAEAFESGVLQGEIAAEYWKNNPECDKNNDGVMQYVVMEGEAGHQDTIVRTEYAVSTIEDKNIATEKVDYAIANWSRDQAKTKMLQMLQQGEAPEMVISNNDAMALGVVDAYEDLGIPKEERGLVFGIDGVYEGLMALKDGDLAGTVYNDKEGQAQGILELAYCIATGGDINSLNLQDGKYIRLPYKRVTKSNLNEYLK